MEQIFTPDPMGVVLVLTGFILMLMIGADKPPQKK